MAKYKYRREETKRKHVDTIINLGEKFFYAAYITPIIALFKYDFSTKSIISAAVIFGLLSYLGYLFLENGFKRYEKVNSLLVCCRFG